MSVIMPAYNEEDTVEFSVTSACVQLERHGFDYEIFIFDDASTDRTGKIADMLASQNSKIKVFHNDRNMNLGFNFARTFYFGCIDI